MQRGYTERNILELLHEKVVVYFYYMFTRIQTIFTFVPFRIDDATCSSSMSRNERKLHLDRNVYLGVLTQPNYKGDAIKNQLCGENCIDKY